MTTPTRDALVRRSAAALFLCAGLITIANQLLAAPAGTRTPVVIGFGLVSLLSGAVVLVVFRTHAAWWVKAAVAVWGLLLLVSTAAFGNTVASPKEPMAVVIFMMVILVWLGLTAGRGLATAFAPLALAAAAVLAALPDSRVVFNDAALVIAVSTAVAETIAWAMHELGRREDAARRAGRRPIRSPGSATVPRSPTGSTTPAARRNASCSRSSTSTGSRT